jgi:hypothetical protein
LGTHLDRPVSQVRDLDLDSLPPDVDLDRLLPQRDRTGHLLPLDLLHTISKRAIGWNGEEGTVEREFEVSQRRRDGLVDRDEEHPVWKCPLDLYLMQQSRNSPAEGV